MRNPNSQLVNYTFMPNDSEQTTGNRSSCNDTEDGELEQRPDVLNRLRGRVR
jgi:hypothetical protein